MVFDRRFTAASPRYPQIRSNGQQQSDGHRPPLQDQCVLLTRSFLMVLGSRRLMLRPRRKASSRQTRPPTRPTKSWGFVSPALRGPYVVCGPDVGLERPATGKE